MKKKFLPKDGERVIEIVGVNGECRRVHTMGIVGYKSNMMIVRDGESVFAVKKWKEISRCKNE